MVRTFIAIPVRGLPLLQNWVKMLRNSTFEHGIKWTNPDNWHITLHFIGDLEEERIPALSESLSEALQGISSGMIYMESAGFFGKSCKPRVLWAGVGISDWLSVLYTSVQSAVSALGLPPEQKIFRPHLTLGRVKKPRSAPWLCEAFESRNSYEWGEVAVSGVVLYKSELTTNGPVYSALKIHNLELT